MSNPHDLRYAHEKFSDAVHALAVSKGRIKDRLIQSYMSFHPLRAKDFPAGDLQQDYERLYAALTRVPAKGSEGSVQATLDVMSEDDAVQLAELIHSLEYRIGEAVQALRQAGRL